MEKTSVQRFAKVLKWLVKAAIVCNIISFVFVPAAVILSPEDLVTHMEGNLLHLTGVRPFGEDDIYVPMLGLAVVCFGGIWGNFTWLLQTAFLLVCGGCTLNILHQARGILDTILAGTPFLMDNALSLRKAAVSSWVISALALVRFVYETAALRSLAPLFTYNTLAVPAFFMAGLLFLVMSALFRQAAELREDQELTI